MANKDRSKQNYVEQHSLPGTNQAGRGPAPSKKGDDEHRPAAEIGQANDQLEKHSLPGTSKGVEIVASELGDDAGITGGAVLARRSL